MSKIVNAHAGQREGRRTRQFRRDEEIRKACSNAFGETAAQSLLFYEAATGGQRRKAMSWARDELGEAHRTMNVARKNGRPDSRRQEKVVRTQGLLSDEDGN